LVVWVLLTFYSCKVITISAIATEKDFDIIVESAGSAV
jgi:hypothetical protein